MTLPSVHMDAEENEKLLEEREAKPNGMAFLQINRNFLHFGDLKTTIPILDSADWILEVICFYCWIQIIFDN